VPPVFTMIKERGHVPDNDMDRTFNMGIGYIIVVDEQDADISLSTLKQYGFDAVSIGSIEKGGVEKIIYV